MAQKVGVHRGKGINAKTIVRKQQIIGAVTELMIRGYRHSSIVDVITMKYGLKDRMGYYIIAHILKKWQKEGEQDMRIKRRRAIEARMRVINRAWLDDNMDLVLKAEDSLSKIEGTEYSEISDRDTDITFNLVMREEDKSSKTLRSFEDDLENPGEFERRTERQISQFCDDYGIDRSSHVASSKVKKLKRRGSKTDDTFVERDPE